MINTVLPFNRASYQPTNPSPMAVILIAGTIPGIPALHNKYEVHLISYPSKLWATISLLQPAVIIIDECMKSYNARKLCRDIKQNKNTEQIAIILIANDPEWKSHADINLPRPPDSESLHAAIHKTLTQP